MKKQFLITCFLYSILILNAKATEFKSYIGININTGFDKNTNYKPIKDFIKNKTTIGLNFGSKIYDDNEFFIFGELYYNMVNKTNNANMHSNISYLSMTAKNLFGLNLGFGYDFNEEFNVRIFASLDNNKLYEDYISPSINYTSQLINYSVSKTKLGYGLGFGLGYNIVKNIEAKIDYKFSDTKYNNNNFKIHAINLGLAYNF